MRAPTARSCLPAGRIALPRPSRGEGGGEGRKPPRRPAPIARRPPLPNPRRIFARGGAAFGYACRIVAGPRRGASSLLPAALAAGQPRPAAPLTAGRKGRHPIRLFVRGAAAFVYSWSAGPPLPRRQASPSVTAPAGGFVVVARGFSRRATPHRAAPRSPNRTSSRRRGEGRGEGGKPPNHPAATRRPVPSPAPAAGCVTGARGFSRRATPRRGKDNSRGTLSPGCGTGLAAAAPARCPQYRRPASTDRQNAGAIRDRATRPGIPCNRWRCSAGCRPRGRPWRCRRRRGPGRRAGARWQRTSR